MKNLKHRLLSLALSAVMVVGYTVPSMALNEENTDGVVYSFTPAEQTFYVSDEDQTFTIELIQTPGHDIDSVGVELDDGNNGDYYYDASPFVLTAIRDSGNIGTLGNTKSGRIAWVDNYVEDVYVTTIAALDFTIPANTAPGDYTIATSFIEVTHQMATDFDMTARAEAVIHIKEAPCEHTSLTKHEAVAATCQAEGTKAYWECDKCGTLFSDAAGKNEISEPVKTAKAAHSYTSEVTAPATCQADGVMTYTCQVCGDSYTEAISKDPSAHKYGDDNKCIYCGNEKPSYQMYMVVTPAEDSDEDGYNDVNAGDTFNGVLYMQAGDNVNINTIETDITFSDKISVLTETAEGNNVEISDVDANTRKVYAYTGFGEAVKDQAYDLAHFTFKVADTAVFDEQLPVSIEEGSYVMLSGKTAEEKTSNAVKDSEGDVIKGVEVYTKYDVTWDANGGKFEGVEGQPSSVTKKLPMGTTAADVEAAAPEDPVWEGHTFAGWEPAYTDVTGSKTYTAKWNVESYKVTYVVDGETLAYDEATDLFQYGSDITFRQAPVKAGYKFIGWCTDENCTVPVADPTKMPKDGITVYGKFAAETYTLTFVDENGLAVENGVVEYTYGTQYADITKPAVPVKAGYDVAWPADVDLITVPGQPETVAAVYTAHEYTITFDADGGADVADMKYTIEDTSAIPETAKDNYTFTGWEVTAADGNWKVGDIISAGQSVEGMYGDVALKALYRVGYTGLDVQDYMYAKTGDKLLLIRAKDLTDQGIAYQYKGHSMFNVDDKNYQVNGVPAGDGYAVYAYIVKAADLVDGTVPASDITLAAGTNEKIVRAGDINDSGTVNVGDAGMVYQMLVTHGDRFEYEGENSVNVNNRLEADMSTSTKAATNRGSIADVMIIVNEAITK